MSIPLVPLYRCSHHMVNLNENTWTVNFKFIFLILQVHLGYHVSRQIHIMYEDEEVEKLDQKNKNDERP